jgi:hypothetical protein
VQPPAAITEAEPDVIQAQVLEAGKMDKDIVRDSFDTSKDDTSTPKKAPEGGMKNYFVWRLIAEKVPDANVEHLAGLHLRKKIGPSPHHNMLSQLRRFRRHYSVDECSLWYVEQLAAYVGANYAKVNWSESSQTTSWKGRQ